MITRAAILLDGELWAGKDGDRHHDIIRAITANGKRAHGGTQGFVTHAGEFLNRQEAARHAIECGQVIVGHANIRHAFNGRELFSEDLW